MKLSLNIAALVSLFVLCPIGSYAYQADNASTETRWLLSPTDRITSDSANNGDVYARRIKFFYEDNQRAEKGCVVFMGDSITQGFPVDKAFCGHLQEDAKRTYVNRGIGGDIIEGMIQRLDVSVRDLQPRTVYIMAGTNDVLNESGDYYEGNIKVGLERLVRRIRELSPGTEIVFETMPPLGIGYEKQAISRYCVAKGIEQMKEVAKAMNIRVIDTHKVLSDESGDYIRRYSYDDVHLNLLGNLQWIDALDLTSAEKAQAWRNLAPEWRTAMDSTRTLTGINRLRGDEDFVLYTPEYGASTREQKSGIEVVVENGKIVSYHAGNGYVMIPKNGYVLSARGGQCTPWLTYCAILGSG